MQVCALGSTGAPPGLRPPCAPNQNLHPADEAQLRRVDEEVNGFGKPLTSSQQRTIQMRLSVSLQEPEALIEEALAEFGATNPNRAMLNLLVRQSAPARARRLDQVKMALADCPDKSADEIAAQLRCTEQRDIDCIRQLWSEARENKNPT